MLVIRLALACVLGCICSASAAADRAIIAMLPLDARGSLAVYGQPVASEVARRLSAAGLEVVVVGVDMVVPRDAALVVEGSLTSVRKRVTVEMRLRTIDSRVALATVTSSRTSLASLDHAASEVADLLLPKVQSELSSRSAKMSATKEPALDVAVPVPSAPPPPSDPVLPTALIAVQVAGDAASLATEFHRHMIAAAAALATGKWQALEVTLPDISPGAMVGAISTSRDALGIAFDVRELQVTRAPVFVGMVRARVIVTFAAKVLFDRVLITDSIVGGRKADLTSMLELMAREVVGILRPRLIALGYAVR